MCGVHNAGPKRLAVTAKITFVCKSLSTGDRSVGQPFTGAAGRWLYLKCLKPLGLLRKDVALHALDNGPLPDDNSIVVAVGRPAGNAIGDRAAVVVPHPFAVMGGNDTGETARKIARVSELLKSTEDAQTEWAGNWQRWVPEDGGQYVYQKHTRGKNIHYDLRLQSKNSGKSFGWTIVGGMPLSKKHTAALPKKEHTDDWMRADGKLPNGDTMEVLASGSYKTGVINDNVCELFVENLTNKDHHVRVLFSSPGKNESGVQTWVSLIPEKNESLAESKSEKTMAKITKADSAKQIVYGVVISPMIIDAHGDWTPPGEVEKIAHDYLVNSRIAGYMHREKDDESKVVESWVEQYPTTEDYHAALACEPHKVIARKFGNDVIYSGDWVMGMKLGDDAWEKYQKGELNAFSPGGTGSRKKLNKQDMPVVEVIYGD